MDEKLNTAMLSSFKIINGFRTFMIIIHPLMPLCVCVCVCERERMCELTSWFYNLCKITKGQVYARYF